MFLLRSQFQHCGALNDTQLRVLNMTMSVTGGVGTLITLLILVALFYAKAYKTPLQRLFMYSLLATMVHEMLHVAQIEEQFEYRYQAQVCMHLGFLSNWSGWVIYIFNLNIILYLVVVVYQQLKKGRMLQVQCTVQKSGRMCICSWLCFLTNCDHMGPI